MSIGSGGGALSFGFTTAKGLWGSNAFDGAIYHQGSSVTVFFAGDGETFTFSGGTFISQQREGSMLTLNGDLYTYTRDDGTMITFDTTKWIIEGTLNALPILVRNPDGSVITIHYGPAEYGQRIQSVTNNRGYQLKYNYPSTSGNVSSVTAINNAIDYCNPVADSCGTLSQNWPTVSVARTSTITPVIDPFSILNVYTITDSANRVSRYTTNLAGYVAGIKRPSSNIDNVNVTYDSTFKATSVTTNGVLYNYAYSTAGDIATLTRTNPLNQTMTAISSLSIGRPSSIKDELNRTTSFTYDAGGRLMTRTSPEGDSVSYVYDIRGNIMTTTINAKPNSGVAPIVTSAVYPAACTNPRTCNKPISSTDALGRVTNYEYDAATGEVTSITSPAAPNGIRPQQRFSYAPVQAFYKNASGAIVASGQPITVQTGQSTCQTTASCAGTADEVKVSINYGAQTAGTANNLLPMSASSGSGNGALTATSAFGYDAIGNITTVDGPLPGTADIVRIRYDAARQAVGAVGADPDGAGALKNRATRSTYNADGQVTLSEVGTVNSQSDADWAGFTSRQQVINSYDANARPIRQSVTAGGITHSVTQQSYDALGRINCQVQRMDPAQWNSQGDACAPQTSGPNGADRITKQIYDAAGQVVKVQTAVGTADQADEVTTTYTGNGLVAIVTDAENNKTSYTYDAFDRHMETHFPSKVTKGVSDAVDYEGYERDANGNITRRRLRDGNLLTYTYDNLNRRTSKLLPKTGSAPAFDNDGTYQYDNLGRITTLSGAVVPTSFAYDALGRTVAESTNGLNKAMQFDAAGRLTRLTYPGGFFVTYDYDVTGNVTAIRENGTASGIGVLGSYSYDDLGRRTSVTRGNGTVTNYSYDSLSRLESLSHDFAGTEQDVISSFTYNPASQIASQTQSGSKGIYLWDGINNVTRPYTTNGLNQYTQSGSTPLGYDGNGNLTSSGTNTYRYTLENRLTAQQALNQPGVSIIYDGSGRLWQLSQAAAVTRFDMLDSAMLSEMSDTNSLLRRYVYGPGSDEPILWYEGAGTNDRRYFHADERGSIIALSNASGTVTQINAYDEFGIPQAKLPSGAPGSTATASFGRFGYTGQAWFPEIGLYHYKARTYSPTLGRFLQSDPIGYGDGMNFYNYVGGDPVNRSDPSGLMCTRSTVGSGGNGGETLLGCGDFLGGSSGVGVSSGVSAPVEGPTIVVSGNRPMITFDVGNFFADQFRGIGSNDLAPPPSLSGNNFTAGESANSRSGKGRIRPRRSPGSLTPEEFHVAVCAEAASGLELAGLGGAVSTGVASARGLLGLSVSRAGLVGAGFSAFVAAVSFVNKLHQRSLGTPCD